MTPDIICYIAIYADDTSLYATCDLASDMYSLGYWTRI